MSSDVPAEIHRIGWLAPWEPTEAKLDVELEREVGPGHSLHGRRAVAVARRRDQDDVLFWLPDGPALLAVVHLTWTGQRERSPAWPFVILYSSIEDWIERGMRPDHAEYSRLAE